MGQTQLTVPDASDLIWVCRRLAAALQGEQSVLVALDAISEGAPPRACRFVQAMRQAAESGEKMGKALIGLGVPSFTGTWMWAGELQDSTRFVLSLTRLAEHLEMEQQLPKPRDPLLFAYGLAFSRIAMMLKEGVPVLQAFEAAAESVSVEEVQLTLFAVGKAIREGLLIGNALPIITEDLPPMVIEMINDGEVAGRIDDVLGIVADYLFDEAGQKEV